jgi:hypothetical protein
MSSPPYREKDFLLGKLLFNGFEPVHIFCHGQSLGCLIIGLAQNNQLDEYKRSFLYYYNI